LALGIARFKALSQYRRCSKVPLDRHAQGFIAETSDGPADWIEKRRRRDLLQRCMTTLTPVHREVINLISYQGKKGEEVAQTTVVPVSTGGHRSRVDGALESAALQKRFRNHRIKTGTE